MFFKVYANNKQFQHANEQEVDIEREWLNISRSKLNHMIIFTKNRIFEGIRKKYDQYCVIYAWFLILKKWCYKFLRVYGLIISYNFVNMIIYYIIQNYCYLMLFSMLSKK